MAQIGMLPEKINLCARNKKEAMICYITGGERSGKTRFAQEKALSLSSRPKYVATSRVWDEQHRKRIERHKSDRSSKWINVEEEKELSAVVEEGEVVLIDCITLWLTNFYTDNDGNPEMSLAQAKSEFEKLRKIEATLIIVSNELGMGVHTENEVGRKFVELQGWMNQHIAQYAEEAFFMVSGIPLKIK